MVRDRSSEFRRQVANNATTLDVLENGSVSEQTSDSFFDDVYEIRRLMESLSNDVDTLKAMQSNILAQATVEERQKEQLDEYMAMIKQKITELKPRLIKMKSNLEDDERRAASAARSATDLRIRRHQVESLIKKLADTIEQFTQTQAEYRQKVTKRIKRQLELAGETPTENEIDAMLDSRTTQVFYRGVTSAAARSALEDATSRHGEILKLEQNIAELSEMYNDVAFLVHSQGEAVERIEDNVEEATAYVHEGRAQTRVAVEYKKSALKKKIYCGVLVTIVLLIIIAVVVVLSVTLTRK